jgi:CDP-diacylglycerol--serine O-phosphatidyltransferase
LAAIVVLFESVRNSGGLPVAALWLIFFAMLFDLLDGLAARLLHAESLHGMTLDSLADVISFGAAPAVLVYVSGLDAVQKGLPILAVYLASGLYLGCAMWRLAVHNSRPMHEADEQNRLDFTGLPSPAAAAMVCSMAWLMMPSQGPTGNSAVYLAYVLPAALLMISSFSYPHLRHLTELLPVWISVVISLSALSLVMLFGMKGLVILSHAYLLSAPVYAPASKCTGER